MHSQLCFSYIDEFLQKYGITLDIAEILRDSENFELSLENNFFIKAVIAYGYEVYAQYFKEISNKLIKNFNIKLNSAEKKNISYFIIFYDLKYIKKLGFESNISAIVTQYLLEYYNEKKAEIKEDIDSAVNKYIIKLTDYIKMNNTKKITDFIYFLYSKLYNEFPGKMISLKQLFDKNKKFYENELNAKDINTLREQCANNMLDCRENIVRDYNKKYITLITQQKNETYALIYFKISQNYFDSFTKVNSFYNAVLSKIVSSYSYLKNYHTLAVHVDNIFCSGRNIKWEIYGYLTIFAEKFMLVKAEKTYYKPLEIFSDYYKYKYGKEITNSIKSKFKTVMNNSSETDFNIPSDLLADMQYFKTINTGYTYIDTYILKMKKGEFPHTVNLKFIEQNNELLVIFHKNEFDYRKIPCPECGSLEVSGNSYSSIGIKSWECKNKTCPTRSKSNRGKRFSLKASYMQASIKYKNPANLIDKRLINKFRKDIIEDVTIEEIFQMLVKYYSYESDIIGSIFPDEALTLVAKKNYRNYKTLEIKETYNNLFPTFINDSPFINRIIFPKQLNYKTTKFHVTKIKKESNYVEVILGNCREYLQTLPKSSVRHMVTSPPYYNARKYSKWTNIFNYLNNIYLIISEAYRVLSENGVFFYNIADVFDNENIIVKSTMGKKKIPLGAYTILIFNNAGFILHDNIIWDKGESQSNRFKNDGNMTPYYQRPANVYEHMFIFGKSDKIYVNYKETKITSSIMKFLPVMKFDGNGKNKYGHTAPFPPTLPLLSISTFTDKNDIILDPFLGSGTSCYAALSLGRNSIGIEINKEFFKLAINKIKNDKEQKITASNQHSLNEFIE